MRHPRISTFLLTTPALRFLAAGMVLCASLAAVKAESKSVHVVDLRCEYLSDPSGIDVVKPRLSWRTDGRSVGLRQTKYQVLVAGKPENLSINNADLWDSGEVASNASVLIPYDGADLRSQQECWWKVRVWNQDGQPSDWSKPGHWSMGLLRADDWKAKWIGTGEAVKTGNEVVPDPWLRKEFTLDKAPSRAVMYVATLGFHELYVNGKKVGDAVLAPSVSDYRKRARYVTYDIGPLLHKGKNAIGLWLGAGWTLYPEYNVDGRPREPMVLAQATFWNGSASTMLVSDETWKFHDGPSHLIGNWGTSSFGGEEYDANKEIPDWSAPNLDESGWEPAVICDPKVEVSAEMVEPNRLEHELYALGIEKKPDGTFQVDMGRNFVGWIEVPVVGKPGQRVEFQYSERQDHAETYGLRSAYIIGPSGHGTFRNRFNYSSGRWMTIKGLDVPPALKDIKGWQIHSDYKQAGSFECSNPLLNQIYATTLWTFENLSLGGYVVDCPQRERRGYGGDAHSTTQTALDNYSMGAFYTKWAQDWRDVQGEDGSLPNTAPTYSGGGGPAWGGYCIHLPWKIYEHYGDVGILKQNFPMMQKWLALVETHSVDGLMTRWGVDWDFLGDWLWPYDDKSGTPNSGLPETLFFNNCYWAYALETASRIAGIIGDEAAARTYRDRASALCAAIHKRFYRPQTHDYANGHQQYIALALLAHVPPASEEKAVWKRLEEEILVHREGHIDAGIVGGALLTRLLIDSNRADLMYTMAIKDDYPSWGHFLKSGLTTIPESWDMTESRLHSSYLFVGAWFMEGLAGIRPGPDGGYQHFVLRPLVDCKPALTHVSASYDSLYGKISCAWARSEGQLELTVTVPPNTSASLYLPFSVENGTEFGRPLNVAKGVSGAKGDSLELEPGTYKLSFPS